MNISNIYAGQCHLRNMEQIEGLVSSIKNNEWIPPIILIENKNGIIWAVNGHHRLLAYILSEREFLFDHEYLLIQASYNYKHLFKMDIIIEGYHEWKKFQWEN